MDARTALGPIVLVAAVAVALALRLGAAPAPQAAPLEDRLAVSGAERAAGLTFAPDVRPADRTWVLQALGEARPEARRLLAEVDGLITIGTHSGQGDAAGMAQTAGERIDVTFDLPMLAALEPYLRRHVVLHELGHAVDFALLDDEVATALDAGVPRSDMCLGGEGTGDCADPAERVADTFAKWAVRSPGYTMDVGYHVAAPSDLDAWGAPLVRLSAGLPRG